MKIDGGGDKGSGWMFSYRGGGGFGDIEGEVDLCRWCHCKVSEVEGC